MNQKRLKLVALDAEDLQVISAHCQDAVLKVSGLKYLQRERRFILELNRFVWEREVAGDAEHERRMSVLHFERVGKVSSTGIDRSDGETVLSLLAVTFEEPDKPAGVIELVFAGNAAVRLDVECIEAQLSDMKASWAAQSVPRHTD